MSQLQQLIKQMCPNGVEWKTLGEVGSFFNGVTGKSKKDFENGNAKFISYMNVFTNPKLKIDVDDTIQINEGEKQNTLQYGDAIFTTSSETPDESGMSAVLTTQTDERLYLNSFCFGFRFNNLDCISPDFYSYIFRSEPLRKQIVKCANGVTRYNISKESFAKVKIPIPPIEIQKRIVEILDLFTNLTATLTAELNLRRKQFVHYREKLLSLDGVPAVERKKLGEVISDLRTGLNPRIHFKLNTNDAKGYYITVRELKGFDFEVDEKTDRINDSAVVRINERSKLKIGDVLFSGTGTIGRTALIKRLPNNYNIKEGVYAITPLPNIIDSKYLIYLFHTDLIMDVINSKAGGSTVRSIPMAELKNIQIPVPPLAVQQSIVEKLDKFTALIGNIEKELDLRQKQYEYYREQLLNFNS